MKYHVENSLHSDRKHHVPVMFDLGSGCLIDLKPFGIHDEPVVKDIVNSEVDLTTFSGDKLLGGPQGGVIVGKRKYIERIQKNPMTRAMRIDKLTLAGFEATLMEYIDEEKAVKNIPTLRMLLQKPEEIKKQANRIARRLKKGNKESRHSCHRGFIQGRRRGVAGRRSTNLCGVYRDYKDIR